MKKKYTAYLWAILIMPIVLLKYMNEMLSVSAKVRTTNQVFANKLFDTQTIMKDKILIVAVENIVLVVVFSIIFGMYIYKDFIANGPYIFTRLKSREKWFFSKERDLMCYSAWYTFWYIISILLVSYIVSTERNVNLGTLKIFVLLWFVYTMIMYMSVLFINFLAVYVDSYISFAIVYSVMIGLVELAIQSHDFMLVHNMGMVELMNPMAMFTIYVQKSYYIMIFGLLYSMVIIGVISVLVAKKLRKVEIL